MILSIHHTVHNSYQRARFHKPFLFFAFLFSGYLPCFAYAAQDLPPGKSFLEYSSPPFIFIYSPEDLPLLEHLVPLAHESYAVLKEWTRNTPEPPILVILLSDHDIANGLTYPLPRNTIRLYPFPPRHPSLLMGSENWLKLLFLHELAHVFHLDWVELPSSLTRSLMGRTVYPGAILNLFSIPFCSGFPNLFLPDTLTEGFATLAESTFLSGGRLDSPLGRTYLRNLALDQDLPAIGGAVGSRRFFPLGDTPYLLGASFHRSLLLKERNKVRDFYHLQAQGCFPCLYGIPFCIVTGSLVESSWSGWRRYQIQGAQEFFARFSDPTPYFPYSKRYLEIRTLTLDPRTGRVFATVNDGIHHEAIGVFTGEKEFQPLIPRHGGQGLYVSTELLLYDELEFKDDTVLISYVRIRTPDGRRINLNPHTFEPDFSPTTGRIAYVVRRGERYCLRVSELKELDKGRERCLPFPKSLHHPHFSPQGDTLVFVLEAPRTRTDIYQWDLKTDNIVPLLNTEVNEWSARFSEEGGGVYLLREADGGVPDLHYFEISTATLYRVTRIPRGIVDYVVDEERRRIWFTSVGEDGFTLYSAPLPQRTTWERISSATSIEKEQALGEGSFRSDLSGGWELDTPGTSPTFSTGELLHKARPYRPFPFLLPTGFTPIVGLGKGLTVAGLTLSSEDPVGDTSYLLTPLVYLKSGRPSPSLFFSFTYDDGQWRYPLALSIQPEFLVGEVRGMVYFAQVRALRRFRWIHHVEDLGVGVEGESHTHREFQVLLGGLDYHLDTRRGAVYFLERGDGVKLNLKVREGMGRSQGGTFGDSYLSAGVGLKTLLFTLAPRYPLQSHLVLGGGAHANLHSPLKFNLLPPLAPLSLPRTFFSHAAPPSGVIELHRLAHGEIQLLSPLLWVNEGLFSLPLYLDGIDFSTYLAGAIWEGKEGGGHSLFVGGELGMTFLFHWSTLLPLRFGFRYSPLVGVRELYLAVYLSDDLVLPRLRSGVVGLD